MNSKLISSEFEELIKSVRIISPTTFTFRNQSYISKCDSEDIDSVHTSSRNYMYLELKDLLYHVYHCRKTLSSDRSISHRTEYSAIQEFIGELSQNNIGKGTWEPDWKIIKIEKDGRIAVQKNDLTLWVFPKDFRSLDGVVQLEKKGYIRMVKEFRRLLPGFYMANSNAPHYKEKQNGVTVRFYWNIMQSHASLLMRNITMQLNKRCIPFKFKILSNPYHYPRADAAVLYLYKQYYNESTGLIEEIYSNTRTYLNSSIPLFAKQLAPGLSLAEDPNCNESYGQHRSRILAEALYSVNRKKIGSIQEIITEIAIYFSNLGIDLNKPYLNPGSNDNYEILSNFNVAA